MIGFNLQKTKRHFTALLAEKYPQREAEQLMRILLEDLFGIDWNQQLMNPNLRIDEFQYYQLGEAVKRLLSGEPVQYVTGMARFCDLLLKVSPSVLIPRPETEELVQKICDSFQNTKPSLLCHSSEGKSGSMESIGGGPKQHYSSIRIWDIGTGSGCIAIALAKHFENAEVYAFDVSEAALEVARENAERNNAKVQFICDDVLYPKSEIFSQPVDLVVSNPPYVCDSERAAMERNVLDWEPENALFVPDDDPLLFYRHIAAYTIKALKPGGRLYFEINPIYVEEMKAMLLNTGFHHVEIKKDMFNKQRFMSAWL